MTEQDRDLGRRFFEEVWNRQRRDAIAELIPPDCVLHERGLEAVGPEGFYPFFDRLSSAFSDIHVNVVETLADGDKICVRWEFTAKHTGHGLGMPPTGLTVETTGISIMRVADGKFREGWQNWDMLGMLEQVQNAPKARTYVVAG